MARKVKITTSLDAEMAQILRDRAALHHLSLSQAAAELLTSAIKNSVPNGDAQLFFAEVRQTLHRDVARMADRLAHLLVRTAFEVGAVRRVVFNLLVRSGLELEAAKRIHDAAWQAAMGSLRKPVAGLRELVTEADTAEKDGMSHGPD